MDGDAARSRRVIIKCPMCRLSSRGYTALCTSSEVDRECPICFETKSDLAVVHGCGHLFCRACLNGLESHTVAEDDEVLEWEDGSGEEEVGDDDTPSDDEDDGALSMLLFGERASFRQRRRVLPIEVARALPAVFLGWPPRSTTFGPFDFLGRCVFWHFRPEFNQHVLVDGRGNLCQERSAAPSVPEGQVADWVRGRGRRNRRWRMLPDPDRLLPRRQLEMVQPL